ncbi:uncharacterized protein FFB14_10588 [Fusarium fujikuroi]|nr:uncharacterized protein FFB14_10588 [Fusarium fujikuroi]
MAEPVGITGTAVGILSFGLQLYTGISEYLDAVKGRDEDLQSAKQYAKMLRDNLVSIEVAISAIGSEYTAARYAIERCKSSCETELKGLEVLLLELKGPMVEPNNRTEQVKNSLRKYSYPFNKKDIFRLQDRLSLTNNALHTAALALQLAISKNTLTTVVSLQRAAIAISQATEDTATGMAEQVVALKQASQTLTQSHQELQLISQRMPPALGSRINEILTYLRDAESPRSQIVQLLQYPQDLRRLCDAVSNLRQNSKTVPRTPVSQSTGTTGCEKFTTYRTCGCATRHDVRRQGRRFGLFLFESEIQKTTYHAPECEMSGVIPIATENKRTFGVHIPAMFKLLDRTVRLSFSVRGGAGGYTICQSINYAATVDESSSLSCRIANMLIRLMDERTPGLSNEDFSVVAESCIRRLIFCYGNKQASPRDINMHGESILDLLAWQLHLLGEFTMPANVVSYILRSLATTKIPITNGSRVKIPFFLRLAHINRIFDSDTAHQTISTLLACCDIPTGQDYQVTYLRYADGKRKGLFENFPDIAENLGFNPLHIATLKNDEESVHHLLHRYPSYLNDLNYCGQSPVHIAIQNKNFRISSAVIVAAHADILNTADNAQQYPIDIATYITCSLLENSEGSHHQSCNQSRVIDLLLESKSLLLHSFICTHFDQACQHTKMVVLSHLAQRRRDMELLAIIKLPAAEVQDLGLSRGRTLDRNTARVQHYLAKRCNIPRELLFYPNNDVPKGLGCSKSIYAYIYDRDVAQHAISLGFDFGTAFTDLFAQVIQDVVSERLSRHGVTYGHASFPTYVCWMIDRGADIFGTVPAGFVPGAAQKITWAHYLTASLGIARVQTPQLSRELPQGIAEVIARQGVFDGCKCWCSEHGCTPLVKILEGLGWRQILQRSEILESYALRTSDALGSLFPRCKDDELACDGIYRAVLRYITFCALGLRHTCCKLVHKNSNDISDDEEIREIHEEDAAYIQILEELMSDFEKEYENRTDLAIFLTVVWVPKMKDIWAKLNSMELTSEEIRSAETIGVIWEVCESEDTWGSEEGEYINPESWARVEDLRSQMGRTRDDKPSVVEEWMRRLDDIAIDPQRPVIAI